MKKTLILSLGRNNSLPIYGKEIISRLNHPYTVWISSYARVHYPEKSVEKLLQHTTLN